MTRDKGGGEKMRTFKVTKDRRVFLNGTEIKSVLGFDIAVEALKNPEVVLRITVDNLDIDGYTDALHKQKNELCLAAEKD